MPRTLVEGKVPQYGLSFQQLPATDMTPESVINEQIQSGRQAIQDKYALQWKEVNRSRRFLGVTKTSRMLRDIDTAAKQEMLQFNQQAQQQLAQLRNIDRLVEVGGITDVQAAKIKAGTVYGRETAEAIYPEPQKEPSIPKQFAELDIYSHRIEDELRWFKEDKPPKPSKALFALGPLIGMTGAYRRLAAAKKRRVRMWDPTTKDYTIKATPEQIAEYDMWLREKRDVAARKKELTGRLDVSRRIVQPGTKGGTFSDKIAESVRPQRQVRQQPTAIELRRQGTREAYEQGKKLGYWR